jgi:hypothetical protein
MTPPPRYWFPAKRYGWGWGPPATWQGWVVLGVWLAAQLAAVVLLAPEDKTEFFAVTAVLVLALVGVCLAKGEPPRWRWGDDD